MSAPGRRRRRPHNDPNENVVNLDVVNLEDFRPIRPRLRVNLDIPNTPALSILNVICDLQRKIEMLFEVDHLLNCALPYVPSGTFANPSSLCFFDLDTVVNIMTLAVRPARLMFPSLLKMMWSEMNRYCLNLASFYEHLVNNEAYPAQKPPLYKIVRGHWNLRELAIDSPPGFQTQYYGIRYRQAHGERFVYTLLDGSLP